MTTKLISQGIYLCTETLYSILSSIIWFVCLLSIVMNQMFFFYFIFHLTDF